MDPLLFATAYTLSTSVGIRPFLTLALASLAMHLGYLHPAHEFAFLGSDGATVLLASFAMLEFIAEKVPAVDHLLHVVHIAAKPVAAAILVGSAAPDIVQGDGSAYTYALMGAAALNALGVHAGIAAIRGASTATTAGLANPFISLIEDAATVVATVLALLAPLAGAALALVVTLLLIFAARAIIRHVRPRATPAQLA
jgi:hypothetical protein